jgi:uncharacterized protein (TIGR02145 family)
MLFFVFGIVNYLLTNYFMLIIICNYQKSISLNSNRKKKLDLSMKKIITPIFNLLISITFAQTNWSVEDLQVTTFRNGDSLLRADSPKIWMSTWENYIPAYTCPEGDCSKGILYNWSAISDPRGLAPIGYRIPTLDDLKTLNENQYYQSKSGWINDGSGSYFNAFPKGNLSMEGNDYIASGYAAYYWTSSKEEKPFHSTGFVIQDSLTGFSVIQARREDYYSVRCIKNESESKYFDLSESNLKDIKNKISAEKSENVKKMDTWGTNNDPVSKRYLIEKKQIEEESLENIKSEKLSSSKRSKKKMPFTVSIKNQFNLNSTFIKKVQFYTSGTIILEPVKESKQSNISSGSLYSVVLSQNRVIIPINTPCVVESQNVNGSLNLKFESAAGSSLIFDTRGSLSPRYYLNADWSSSNSSNWVVTYQGQKYRINSSAGNVYLMVKMKRMSKKTRSERVIGGMKV